MLFRTSTLRSRLALVTAVAALVSGVAAAPADAGSKKMPWLLQNGDVVLPGNAGRPNARGKRGQPPTQARVVLPRPMQQPGAQQGQRRDGRNSRYLPPAPPAPRGARRNHESRGYPPVQQPAYTQRNRPGGHNGNHTPPPVYNYGGGYYGGQNHDRHYSNTHVQRYYYYRTSPRQYYYYNSPQPYPAPVYYLVPYHVHAVAGYHDHGEPASYCNSGYANGGVYTGGAYTGGASHQNSTALLGGILGAAVGSQVGKGNGKLVAVGVGTVIGALIGSDAGRAMDVRDNAYATGSFGHAMEATPTCTTISWNNQQTGNYGSVTPTNTYEPEPGRYCREFQQQVAIDGKLQDAYGTACRQPDGSWEIVAEQP